MRFGLTVFSTASSLDPAGIACAAEAAGFDLLLFPDHTHLPLPVRSAYPGGGDVPMHYADIYDPLVACAFALSVTSTLRVGIGVVLVPARDPIVLAKQVASLDVLSGGRMVLGVGAGWNAEEIEDHGVAAADRWAVLRDRVHAMRALWTSPGSGFSSTHATFGPMAFGPTPLRSGGPHVIVGGHGPGVVRRVVDYGDEWLVMPSPGAPPLATRIEELQRACEAAGRAPVPVSAQVYARPGELPPDRVIERYAEAGVERIDLGVAHAAPDAMASSIAALAATVDRHR